MYPTEQAIQMKIAMRNQSRFLAIGASFATIEKARKQE